MAMIIEPSKDLWVRSYAAVSGARLEFRVFRWTLARSPCRSPCGGFPWRLSHGGLSLAWEAIADDGVYYQAVICMGAKLPLDHFWRSSYPSPVAVTSMSSTTVIAPFIDSDRVCREFRNLEHLWLDWCPTAANPVVSTTDGEDFEDVHYEVKHQAGLFKQASGHRTTIHVFTCPRYATVDREGRPKTEHHVVWGRCLGNSGVSRRMPRSFGESRQARATLVFQQLEDGPYSRAL